MHWKEIYWFLYQCRLIEASIKRFNLWERKKISGMSTGKKWRNKSIWSLFKETLEITKVFLLRMCLDLRNMEIRNYMESSNQNWWPQKPKDILRLRTHKMKELTWPRQKTQSKLNTKSLLQNSGWSIWKFWKQVIGANLKKDKCKLIQLLLWWSQLILLWTQFKMKVHLIFL